MDRICVMCNYVVYQSVEIKGESQKGKEELCGIKFRENEMQSSKVLCRLSIWDDKKALGNGQ